LDQVFDADRHAVDRTERFARLVTSPGFVSGLAGAIEIEKCKCPHVGLERLDTLDATFEIGPRGIAAVAKPLDGVVKAQHPVRDRIVDASGRPRVHEMWV